jgi:hypothetical protein
MGLSDHKGTAALSTQEHNSGLTRVISGDEIQLTTMDDFCREHKVTKLDLIKLDVEGHEECVLCGGENTLLMFRPVILIELNPFTLKCAGSSVERVVEILRRANYTLFTLHRDKLLHLKPITEYDDYINAFCFPTERAPCYT